MDNTVNPDAFANVTDNLIIVILSLLPFKEAVRTSVLSKQWQSLWRSTQRVEFDQDQFVKKDAPEALRRTQREGFIQFIRRFVTEYNGSVIKSSSLALSKPEDCSLDLIHEFVRFAFSRGVKEFGLDLHDPNWNEYDAQNQPEPVVHLPGYVYENTSIRSLTLLSCKFLEPNIFNFTNLKQLSLGWVQLSGNFFADVLQSCPLLEDLSLKNCWGLNAIEVNIPSLRLQRLVLDKCNLDYAAWMCMTMPNLEYFKFCGCMGQFQFESATNLAEVELDFVPMEVEYMDVGELLAMLLCELFAVRTLTVDSYLLQLIPHAEDPLGLQGPLCVTHLILNTGLHTNESLGIRYMFYSCPSLETLTLNIVPPKLFNGWVAPYDFDPSRAWTKNTVKYRCLEETLKVVNVNCFNYRRGGDQQLSFLNYVIRLGQVLEQVNLYVANEADPLYRQLNSRIADMVLRIPRRSRNLQVSIY